jgi:hypothetical protein
LIAAILLGDARTRLFSTPSHYQIPQSSYWLGSFEVLAATTILLLTAHVWWLYIAGGVLFGVFKGLVAFMVGSDLFPIRHVAYSRIQALGLIAYCLVTLLLLWRFSAVRFTIVDRIALTIWLFCFLSGATSLLSAWQLVGLGVLGLSWLIPRITNSRRSSRLGMAKGLASPD